MPIEAIAYFFRDGSYNFLCTVASDGYVVSQSIDDIEGYLSSHDFFRTNRQILVSRKACTHFAPLPYNKLEFFVTPVYKFQIVISQMRNKGFREWLEG